MKIAVTGATGFFGKHLVRHLSTNKNNEIVALVRSNNNNPFENLENVSFVYSDFSKDNLSYCLKDVDQLINLAGLRMPRSTEYVGLEYFFNANIKLIEDIANAAKENNVKRILFSSSIAVYGDFNSNEGISEGAELKPINNYGLSKLIGEKLLYHISQPSNLEVSSMRFSQIYGRGERKDLIMANFINRLKNDKDITINTNGYHERDYLYIDDAVDAITSLINADSVSDCYNIGSNRSYSACEIAQIIKEEVDSNSRLILSKKPHLIKKQFMNTAKIKNSIGWNSKCNIRDSIKKML